MSIFSGYERARAKKLGELHAENQQLRTVVVSLGAALLREVALDSVARQRPERANAFSPAQRAIER
jgi:hypothetical protein